MTLFDGETRAKIKRIVYHPKYRQQGTAKNDYDFALLEMEVW